MKRDVIKRVWTQPNATKRRQEMLQRQREARRDLTSHTRSLVESHMDVSDRSEDPCSTSKRRTREERCLARREHFAKQLMVPEWLVDIPEDLNGKGSLIGEGWFVMPRPEGKRCLVVSSSGVTIARNQSGSILKKFPSALPSGSRKTNSDGGYCILDCIYQEADQAFYVLDVMCWKSYLLYDCTTEFRFYWLRNKLNETSAGVRSSANPYLFMTVPYHECDESGVLGAYQNPVPFVRDGLLFYMKAAHYVLGLTPLVLVWKDSSTSRYFVFSEKPTIVLKMVNDTEFATLEGLKLLSISADEKQRHELDVGDLAQFTFDEASLDCGGDHPRLMNYELSKRCSPQRALADSWTKILFQLHARTSGVQIERILQAVQLPSDLMKI